MPPIIYTLVVITLWTVFLIKIVGLGRVTGIIPKNPGEHKSEMRKALEQVPSNLDTEGAKLIRDKEEELRKIREKYSKKEE